MKNPIFPEPEKLKILNKKFYETFLTILIFAVSFQFSFAGDLPGTNFRLKDNSITRSKYPRFILSVNAGINHLTYDHANKLILGADLLVARTDKFYLGAGGEFFKDVEGANIIGISLYPMFVDNIFNNKMKIYATFALSFYYWDKKVYPAITPFLRLDYKIGRYIGLGIDFKVPLLFSGRVSSSPFIVSKLNLAAFIW